MYAESVDDGIICPCCACLGSGRLRSVCAFCPILQLGAWMCKVWKMGLVLYGWVSLETAD